MKFGKLADISEVDFRLPLSKDADLTNLSGTVPSSFHAYVGCPRWSSKAWIGEIYPKGTPAGQYLQYYAQSFNSIELNSTHYRIPTKAMVQQWYEASQPAFRFCPKVPQVISHRGRLDEVTGELQRFTDAITGFGDRLGHSFLQLHESFGPQRLPELAGFLAHWPSELPLCVEFRHHTWFEAHRLIPEVVQLLAQHHIAPVITDVAGRRDVLHQSITAPTIMVRLVGSSLDVTDYQRVDAWVKRIAEWREQGLQQVYLFSHQPEDQQAATYGAYIIRCLNEQFHLNLSLPGLPNEAGSQMSLF